jgi:hypothetical protein
MFSSRIVGFPIQVSDGPDKPEVLAAIIVIGFISGFSERFANDLLGTFADNLGRAASKSGDTGGSSVPTKQS